MSKKPPAEPENKGPDETEVRQAAVVASTFANVELQSTRQTLQQYVQLYQAAKEENQRLALDLAERDKDSMSVVHFLRSELEKRQEAIKEQQKKNAEELEQAQAKFNEERKQLLLQIEEKGRAISAHQQTISDLEADLDALSAFKRERNDIYLELARFKEQQKADTQKYEAEISHLRFQSLEEKVRLKAEERTLSEKFEKEVNSRAMKLLDSKTKEIHSENYLMVQDKVLLEKELERLSRENRTFSTKLKESQREAELGSSAETELVARNARLTKQNRQLLEKVAELETQLTQAIEKYEIKLKDTTEKLSKQLNAVIADRDEANRNAAARHTELVRMRKLTKQVVTQRTDLEMFFNEALEYVRSEIARERAAQLKSSQTVHVTARPQKPKRYGNEANEFLRGNFEALPNPNPNPNPTDGATGGALVPSSREGGRMGTRQSSSAGSLPPIGPSNPGSRTATAERNAPPVSEPTRIDISELSWVDKERVLRILFTKINQVRDQRHPTEKRQNHLSELDSVPTAAIEAPPNHMVVRGDETFLTTDPYREA